MKILPLARTGSIVVQSLGKEILIYDLNTHKAFNLNETSAIVYQACDGKTSFDEFKRQHKFTDDLIHLALDELQHSNLIEADSFISPFAGMNRREVIRKVGLTSLIALPVISALLAPTAASAQSPSNLALGQTCTSSRQCSSSASNCAARNPSTGSSRCCIGAVSYYDTGGVVNSCSGGACSSATFSCQADANQFCCSNSATVSCSSITNSCACRCN